MGVRSKRARIKKKIKITFKAKQMLLLCHHRRHLGFGFLLRFFFFNSFEIYINVIGFPI